MGLQTALTQLEQAQAEAAYQEAAALKGSRPAMSKAAMDETSAADVLLTAEAMLQAVPDLETLKCAHVEVCPDKEQKYMLQDQHYLQLTSMAALHRSSISNSKTAR